MVITNPDQDFVALKHFFRRACSLFYDDLSHVEISKLFHRLRRNYLIIQSGDLNRQRIDLLHL